MSAEFLASHTAELTLRDGGHIRIRPIVADDKAALLAGVQALSPLSRYRRFFSPLKTLSPEMLRWLTEVDYDNHFAWVAVDLDTDGHPGVGVARYIRLAADPRAAEVAVAVNDHHQRRGIGVLLLEVVGLTAREHGIEWLEATVLADNGPTRALVADLGGHLRWDKDLGALRAVVPIVADAGSLPDPVVRRVLQAAARGEIRVAMPGGQAVKDEGSPGDR